jgi:pimeloyl-ACP methyl ester carboxylesterase
VGSKIPVDEHTISLDQTPVFYRTAGAVESRILYLHGAPTSSDDWIELLGRTGGVAPDLLGFGRSGKGGHLDYTPDALAAFVVRLLDELGLGQVTVIAHDWGAAVALVLAARAPERVQRLVLLNATPIFTGVRWPRLVRIWRAPALGELAMGATTKTIFAWGLRRGSVSRDAWPQARVDALWQQFDQGTQRALLRLYRWADEQRLSEAQALLDAVTAPARIIWGERDPWLSVDLADEYARRLPGASVERIANAGHWPWLDDPGIAELLAR